MTNMSTLKWLSVQTLEDEMHSLAVSYICREHSTVVYLITVLHLITALH